MNINSLCVKPSGEAVLLSEGGERLASGVLSRPALLSLHLQVLLALLRGADLEWQEVERPQDFLPPA